MISPVVVVAGVFKACAPARDPAYDWVQPGAAETVHRVQRAAGHRVPQQVIRGEAFRSHLCAAVESHSFG